MKFILNIDSNDDGMQNPYNVASALRNVINQIERNYIHDEDSGGAVLDINGNIVGNWEMNPVETPSDTFKVLFRRGDKQTSKTFTVRKAAENNIGYSTPMHLGSPDAEADRVSYKEMLEDLPLGFGALDRQYADAIAKYKDRGYTEGVVSRAARDRIATRDPRPDLITKVGVMREVVDMWRGRVMPDRAPEPEKLYLVGGCGEVFDDIQIAHRHMVNCRDCSHEGFDIQPESEAL